MLSNTSNKINNYEMHNEAIRCAISSLLNESADRLRMPSLHSDSLVGWARWTRRSRLQVNSTLHIRRLMIWDASISFKFIDRPQWDADLNAFSSSLFRWNRVEHQAAVMQAFTTWKFAETCRTFSSQFCCAMTTSHRRKVTDRNCTICCQLSVSSKMN